MTRTERAAAKAAVPTASASDAAGAAGTAATGPAAGHSVDLPELKLSITLPPGHRYEPAKWRDDTVGYEVFTRCKPGEQDQESGLCPALFISRAPEELTADTRADSDGTPPEVEVIADGWVWTGIDELDYPTMSVYRKFGTTVFRCSGSLDAAAVRTACMTLRPFAPIPAIAPRGLAAPVGPADPDCGQGGSPRTAASKGAACSFVVDVLGPLGPSGGPSVVSCCYASRSDACHAAGCQSTRCSGANTGAFVPVACR